MVPAGSWASAAFTVGLQRTLCALDDLMNEPEDDEYGPARPTAFARQLAFELLQRAASLLDAFPVGSASTDTAAGIRLTWRNQTRQLRLVLAPTPEGRSYLYAQAGENHRITENIAYDTLAALLMWLNRGSEE